MYCIVRFGYGQPFPRFARAPTAANTTLAFDQPAVLKRARKSGIDDSAQCRSPDRLRPGRAPLSMGRVAVGVLLYQKIHIPRGVLARKGLHEVEDVGIGRALNRDGDAADGVRSGGH